MNASEAQNCAKVQVRHCDDQSAVDDENAQSVTQYYSVGGNIDLNNLYEPMQSVEVTVLGQTEVTTSQVLARLQRHLQIFLMMNRACIITQFAFHSYSISLWSERFRSRGQFD